MSNAYLPHMADGCRIGQQRSYLQMTVTKAITLEHSMDDPLLNRAQNLATVTTAQPLHYTSVPSTHF